MEEDEVQRVVSVCRRLEPIINRFVCRLIEKDGANVSISIISNLATNFMAQAITMVEARGGDVDQFVKIMMVETKNKYDVASAQVQTESALSKMMLSGMDPNETMH